MVTPLIRARTDLERASDTADHTLREQLRSIDEGLEEIVGGDKTRDEPPHGDRLVELERKLEGLAEETDGETREAIETARRRIDAYRRRETTET